MPDRYLRRLDQFGYRQNAVFGRPMGKQVGAFFAVVSRRKIFGARLQRIHHSFGEDLNGSLLPTNENSTIVPGTK